MKTEWNWRMGRLLALAFLLMGLSLGAAEPASAAEFVYSPTLSLTGLDSPRSVAVDSFGDRYVASYGSEFGSFSGRVDVFGPGGAILTQITGLAGPRSLAVDGEGNLYVFNFRTSQLVRFSPTEYHPEEGKIGYADPPTVLRENLSNAFMGLAVNRLNDHLFAFLGVPIGGNEIAEFNSAAEGNGYLGPANSVPLKGTAVGLAIDASRGLIYASQERSSEPDDPYVIEVFELAAPHNVVNTIDGSDLPEGKFVREPTIAVDESTGDLFLYYASAGSGSPVYRTTGDGEFIESINHNLKFVTTGAQPAIDNGNESPNKGDLFVPSNPLQSQGEVVAFVPREVHPPQITAASFANVTRTEAELTGTILPGNLETSYSFEYTTVSAYGERGFEGATVASGSIPAGAAPAAISATISGLQPATAYRFRLVAVNEAGSDEEEGGFSTYPPNSLSPCANDGVRFGISALLPDCRAYELVTPPSTNARRPIGLGHLGLYFPTQEASPSGNSVSFQIEGGAIPGTEATGTLAGDPYLATRGSAGWSTTRTGPTPAESLRILPGGSSPDQGYAVWRTDGASGTLIVDGKNTTYVRYPDGHVEPMGQGSLRTDPEVTPKLVSENGGHIIFTSGEAGVSGSGLQLEPNAPPSGTRAIYDRTGDTTHVISLLPNDETPAAGEDATYVGSSLDGRGVAFTIGGVLYLRRDNLETFEIGTGLVFAGVAEGGGRLFYLQAGNLKAFDAVSGKTITFATGGDVTPVNVAANGTAAYFVSPDVLTTKVNPVGAKAQAGEENLYLSREGELAFVGTVTERDVAGEDQNGMVDGLGLWTEALGGVELPARLGVDPSRTTPDGAILLFESRAQLTGYDSADHAEIYRYDAAGNLQCLSCDPTGTPASTDARLQSISAGLTDPEPLNSYNLLNNLVQQGRRAFFESSERLALGDTDGLRDVYEWEDQGVGSCTRAGGCVYLISSGRSSHEDYLYAVSGNGDDVFFLSSDLLVGKDQEETPSIYDARVGGGFLEGGEPEPCQGEGCRPSLDSAPALPSSRTAVLETGNKHPRRCPKGKRKVKRHGKVRCVKKHHRHERPHHRRADTKEKGARG